ncbi:winged helix-turn-helix transcriptional regulator [Pseudoalteromonas denitrificans]|jgi:DNA-binding HxlR family transcriptional regulator|uniref:Transcriptional regulator, HxlR family n=1 Tax=Pseudoalteromonas denitrificans DSM 6059 TaxID=1123010 RepID=A0A1I1UW69_9GAMM|nr:helix-turn-helix domain-containing protein [Pseudoalteromonas denitrificans]SFD74825.1 transcriptional regulator, HxlR family [Pseudoalteromonas denitrificans DSM 6059]
MKRSYRQNCALALTSDVLTERWTLLIIRELLISPCRFKDLNNVLHSMGTNLLTTRLKELESMHLIERKNENNKRSAYQLTKIGLDTEPLVLAMIKWGNQHLTGQSEFTHHNHWDLLAMKALFNQSEFKKEITLQFKHQDFCGWAKVSKNGFTFGLGDIKVSDLQLNMTIAELKTAIDNKDKSILENLILPDFIRCF